MIKKFIHEKTGRTIYKPLLPSFLFYTRKVGHLKRKKRSLGVIVTHEGNLEHLLEQHPTSDIFFYNEVTLDGKKCTNAFIFDRNGNDIILNK